MTIPRNGSSVKMPAMLNGVTKTTTMMAAPSDKGVGEEPKEPVPTIPKNTPPPYRQHCNRQKERQCQDGSCVPRIELCPEEQLINQNTILIMIVVGIAVVVFVVILYCLQQRRRYRGNSHAEEVVSGHEDGDNVSLYQPPPSYDEVISSNLYPPTPSMLRLQMVNMGQVPEDVPMTPPPNYDTALYILSRSQELTPSKQSPKRVVRRSISMSQVGSRENSHSPPATPLENEVFSNNNNSNSIPPPPPSPQKPT